MGWNNALSERGVFKNITIIPAFLFIIFSSVFTFSSIWICIFIFLFILNKLMLCFQNEKPYSLLFDCGFLIGLADAANPTCEKMRHRGSDSFDEIQYLIRAPF